MGAGAWPGSDARREGPVRSRAPDVTRPFRWRDLMDEPASGGTRPAARQKPSDQASILDPAGELHAAADDCVHCGVCLPACPSGVRYDRLIEAARTWTEEPQPGAAPVPARSQRERAVRAAIFATFP